ncbi:hypothetical protein [Streptomyces sp. NPDC090445]|uniref:hypothetical protein n=1 Tax=Streptomyces sp. NPDC090445 TaxID=3365963 RepID=UPI00382EFEE3
MPHRTATPAPAPDTAAPDTPAHSSTRPLHWLATACATAAVIAGAGFLQPEATAAGPATPEPANRPTAPQAAAPDPAAVTWPLDCKGAPTTVTATAQGDLDGDRRPETVAAVRCDAGSGTPPHALYVLTQDTAKGTPPRIVATLLDTARRQTATDLTIRDGTITAQLLGYSSPDVPRYNPDVKQLAKWRWSGGKFRQELTQTSARSV